MSVPTPIHQWEFEEASATDDLVDSVGSATLTVQGSPPVGTGDQDGARVFISTSPAQGRFARGATSLADRNAMRGEWTIAVRVYLEPGVTSLLVGCENSFAIGGNPDANALVTLGVYNSGEMYCSWQHGLGAYPAGYVDTYTTELVPQEEFVILYARKKLNGSLYDLTLRANGVNQTFAGVANSTGGEGVSPAKWWIGGATSGAPAGGSGYSDASIFDVKIWDVALTDGEIEEDEAGAATPPDSPTIITPTEDQVIEATNDGSGTGFVSVSGTTNEISNGVKLYLDGVLVFTDPDGNGAGTFGTSVTASFGPHYLTAVETDPATDLESDPTAHREFTLVEAEFGEEALTIPPSVFTRSMKQLLPQGPLWLLDIGSWIDRVLRAISDELSRVGGRGEDLIEESDPRTATETLEDWERVLGLPDDAITAIPVSDAARRLAITQKLIRQGGQHSGFYIALALACGYVVTIQESFSGDVFRAGTAVAGDLLGGLHLSFQWGVTVSAPAGTALTHAELEAIINRAKPAHTTVVFTYL